jgi:hypothetical protein
MSPLSLFLLATKKIQEKDEAEEAEVEEKKREKGRHSPFHALF